VLFRRKAIDDWHDYRSEAKKRALCDWCEVHSLEIADRPDIHPNVMAGIRRLRRHLAPIVIQGADGAALSGAKFQGSQ
jgi:hypothetical protein